ncbi:DUF1338 domain-containing protein [Parvularcula sp. ZS-1/3]|uniref:2-oxoadipate dioxygenase/decarboxylase n=1 Tax=Parvularcula mediterranea TaxID=2732508 RepID=A0A7Y3RLV1_9PROT|nr:DUF1338 domain-containing protein [Parvularcula mediterranea]NNU16399.1 DUF1338 domain-containing protein [Parvularcula mediterranea]
MTDLTLDSLFGQLWQRYAALTPQADAIRQLFEGRGETVINDHVAFRTLNDHRLGIDKIAAPFLSLGYEAKDEYRFEQKKLFARYYAHEDETRPKVFISELLLEECSDDVRQAMEHIIDQMTEEQLSDPLMLNSGRCWKSDFATYERLYEESEYAAWFSAFGFCANHFTVFVNALEGFKNLEELASFIEDAGYPMNRSGGLVKGSPEVYLEQCSTMATKVTVSFEDGEHELPSCFYEFAKRFEMPAGGLYQGFVAASADKIFESTNR